jgi:hypothetical protein
MSDDTLWCMLYRDGLVGWWWAVWTTKPKKSLFGSVFKHHRYTPVPNSSGIVTRKRTGLKRIKEAATFYDRPYLEDVDDGRRWRAEKNRGDSDSDEKVDSSEGAGEDAGKGTGQGASSTGSTITVKHVPKRVVTRRCSCPRCSAEPKAGDPEGSDLERDLPVEKSDMPILAHRSASLLFNGDTKPFGSVAADGVFGLDSHARCRCGMYQGSTHSKVPAIEGACGFYALPIDKEATYPGKEYVTLQVELYGRVLVCDYGYRAQFQRVVECQLPPCPYCNRKAEYLHIVGDRLREATCEQHTWTFLGIDDNDVPDRRVVWLPPNTVNNSASVTYLRLPVEDLGLGVPITRQGL